MSSLQIHELGPLFQEVQMRNILGDGKTFPDCIPKRDLLTINEAWLRERQSGSFDLHKFILSNFSLPAEYAGGYRSDPSKSARQHIHALWDVLARDPGDKGGSLLPLPHAYIVPGGRFREIYYWDSYFTMLGLGISGQVAMIQNMIDNFSHLIHTIGYIPNGNRTYFLGRSQPPFFSLMIKLLSKINGDRVWPKYLPALVKEYQFWMKGSEGLSEANQAQHRVVRMADGSVLNRYWDENNTPRPEAYKEDVELASHSIQKPEDLYRHLRAAAESGWDFSSRWFRDARSFDTIHTTEIIPVDLNCLLLHLEQTLSEAYRTVGNSAKASEFVAHAANRKASVRKYCWNADRNFFFDFDFVAAKQKDALTLAAAFPLFFEMASPAQALAVGQILSSQFLKPGGLTTTLEFSGQQWDAPNGWAPLQWIAYQGLLNYGMDDIAGQVKSHWINANLKVYQKTGKMTEKYDVWSDRAEASGGEYPNQDGFGWTNGVFLAMEAHKE